MKILITGGNGYIAKSIHSYLYTKYDITVITRNDFDLTDWQQTNDWFRDKSFDVVIHTAAAGGSRLKQDDDSIIRKNLLMYRNLLNHQDKFDKFISFGSGAELNNPTSPYGLSKQIIAESMFSKTNFLNLRIYAVFDENELNSRFIKRNLLRYNYGEDMIIHMDKYMDFFYMKDLIALIDYFLSKDEWTSKVVDCCYLEKNKLSDISNIINNLDTHKVNVAIEHDIQAENYIGNYVGLPIKLIGLKRGILETYNNIR
jgi:dTDP-4-dehydrorhamnose reductase